MKTEHRLQAFTGTVANNPPAVTCTEWKSTLRHTHQSLDNIAIPVEKMLVYQTLVLPVLFYARDTWTIRAADTKRLEAFHMKCQRQIMKICWQDHIRNTEEALLTHWPLPNIGPRHTSPERCLWTHR